VNALQRFRSLLGMGNALPAGKPREAYALGLGLATSDDVWRRRAYANAAEILRLQRFIAERLEGQQPDAADRQAGQILRNLEAWCNQKKPGRGFRASVRADGTWSASLIECERRSASGEDLADALGQIAQTASYELPVN
jgi:hypothetical protein